PSLGGAVIETIDRLWGLAGTAEITLEANPGSADRGRFAGYRLAGVNRLSLGIQALDDAALAALGRRHSAAEAVTAWEAARETFPRASFDLICGRPGQTPRAWEAELKRAISLAPDHVSVYQLTMEPGTPFHALHARGRLRLPDEETALRLFAMTDEMLREAGLARYEVSNHARAGEECRHNLLYWRHGPYAGIGPGAHSRLHVAGDGGERPRILAVSAVREPRRWLETAAGGGIGDLEELSPGEAAAEALLMGLRTSEGVPLARLARRLGRTPREALPPTAGELTAEGLLRIDGGDETAVLRLTPRGLTVMDAVVERLTPDDWLS
ncbi:MAG TPA: radical SAM protein, partial [Thermopetrobacter sp.]|nr:radical SAM protein [Thermopetrobacter sp.]